MARKTATVTIARAGRDQGKTFHLTEMPAVPAERWATRALFAVTHNLGPAVEGVFKMDREEIGRLGMAGVAALGVKIFGQIDPDEVQPLLDEMMECVELVPDPTKPGIRLPWSQAAGQIEEVSTLLQLRDEVVALHVGFSLAARLSTFKQAGATIGSPDT